MILLLGRTVGTAAAVETVPVDSSTAAPRLLVDGTLGAGGHAGEDLVRSGLVRVALEARVVDPGHRVVGLQEPSHGQGVLAVPLHAQVQGLQALQEQEALLTASKNAEAKFGAVYDAAFDQLIMPVVRSFRPDWILVSAGYDAHADDPLAELKLASIDSASAVSGNVNRRKNWPRTRSMRRTRTRFRRTIPTTTR